MRKQYVLVAAFLVAIVAANLTVAWWGPSWSIVNAFLFIGLDLTSRDGLHELWHLGVPTTNWWQRHRLARNMGALIATGSLLSWALNADAGRIALASFLAFALAATVDTIVFQRLFRLPRFDRINGSNIVSAAVDSLVFPAIAFGFPMMWDVAIGQWGAKVGGGLIWAWILFRRRGR